VFLTLVQAVGVCATSRYVADLISDEVTVFFHFTQSFQPRADRLDNVGSLTSHNPIALHGMLLG
jgi:hypothetical protein